VGSCGRAVALAIFIAKFGFKFFVFIIQKVFKFDVNDVTACAAERYAHAVFAYFVHLHSENVREPHLVISEVATPGISLEHEAKAFARRSDVNEQNAVVDTKGRTPTHPLPSRREGALITFFGVGFIPSRHDVSKRLSRNV
jgi:hypothetical protein